MRGLLQSMGHLLAAHGLRPHCMRRWLVGLVRGGEEGRFWKSVPPLPRIPSPPRKTF
nr:hypothetical protein RVX_2518 [Nitratidesulfovibrio sp. HK-II]